MPPKLPEPMKAQDLSSEVDLDAADLGLSRFFRTPGEYAMEPKLDGCRVILELQESGNRIWSKGRDVSDHFPHLQEAVIGGADSILLDGELLATGENGQILSAATSLLVSTAEHAVEKQRKYGPAWFMIFDILYVPDVILNPPVSPPAPRIDVLKMPYEERRVLMDMLAKDLNEMSVLAADGVFEGVPMGTDPIQLVPSYPAAAEHIDKFRGGEGFMIKRRAGRYVPGGRESAGWWKFKWLYTADVFITGYTAGRNSLEHMVGSLECAIFSPPDLSGVACAVDIASVGVFTQGFRRELTAADGSLKEEWYGQVIEIAGQCLGTNFRVRHPRFIRPRPDKHKSDCGPEQVAGWKRG